MVKTETLLELVDLRRQRRGISSVAIEHLDGHRTAVRGAEQAVDDLQAALLAVPAVSAFGQRTTASLQVARRDVVEHQRAILQMAPGQRGLDGRLARQQPIECGVVSGCETSLAFSAIRRALMMSSGPARDLGDHTTGAGPVGIFLAGDPTLRR